MARVTHLNVNGQRRALDVDADTLLLYVLRGPLDLTGTKYGCGEGQCAACTVLIDGAPRHSCRTRVGDVGEGQITTIEGLAPDDANGRLHPVQQAFLEAEAFQCGYCTSGMILGVAALLRQNPHPTREQAIAGLQGHICRCGTYDRILNAVAIAARKGSA